MPRSAEQTEELANSASHGLGCLLALAAWPVLAAPTTSAPAALRQAGATVFIMTMLAMFAASALYHAAPPGPARQQLRRFDHAAIFLFIAGSCTPFAIGNADRTDQWPLLAAVWALAVAGMLLKLADRLRRPTASTLLYLAFGWLAAAAVWPTVGDMGPASRILLVAGGVAYTVGSGVFLLGRRLRYGHLAWHLLVVTGSASHLAAMLLFLS